MWWDSRRNVPLFLPRWSLRPKSPITAPAPRCSGRSVLCFALIETLDWSWNFMLYFVVLIVECFICLVAQKPWKRLDNTIFILFFNFQNFGRFWNLNFIRWNLNSEFDIFWEYSVNFRALWLVWFMKIEKLHSNEKSKISAFLFHFFSHIFYLGDRKNDLFFLCAALDNCCSKLWFCVQVFNVLCIVSYMISSHLVF